MSSTSSYSTSGVGSLQDERNLAPTLRLRDIEAQARATLPPDVWGYFAGGGFDELTTRECEEAWTRWRVSPSVLVDVSDVDMSTILLGQRRAHPVVFAPSANHGFTTPLAEVATATAALTTDSIACVSIGASLEPAEVARRVPESMKWLQTFLWADPSATREIAALAMECGYEAIVVTVDGPVIGSRTHPPVTSLKSSAVSDGVDLPERLRRPVHHRLVRNPAATWADLEALANEIQLPIIVKGVLSSSDALRARDAGAAGVVVSNHGGRQLDRAVPSAAALEGIVDAVGENIDVIVDGGIRSGIDVLVALSLGARAVMIGRPVLWGLAVNGSEGAAEVVHLLLAELNAAMALAGARSVDRLDRSILVSA